jgi:hypothetical protein
MFELFNNLPSDKSIIGRFNSEESCHRKAETLKLSAYCINLYIREGWNEVLYDTWCFSIK